MTQHNFKEKMNAMETFLVTVERDSGPVTANDFPQFKEFVVSWVITLGKARLAHVHRENDPVDKLVAEIQECVSTQGVRQAWKKGMQEEIMKMEVRTFWQAVPSAIDPEAAERGLDRGGIQRGRCSRLCGGHGWCGASWLKCRSAEGPQPSCCSFVSEAQEGADPQAFSPFTVHVLGLCTVKILSHEHWDIIVLFLMDIAVMTFQMIQNWDGVALDVVLINSVCLVCMIVCFEQISIAEKHAKRVSKFEKHIA